MLEIDGQNACDHFDHRCPLLVEAAHTVYANTKHSCGCQTGDSALSNIDRKRKKRILANQDVTDVLPKLFEQSIVAVAVNEK